MLINLNHNGQEYQVDLSQAIDISIPLGQVKCFHAPDVVMKPYTSGDFIGSVKAGAPVNFYNVQLNPHGNGTHTECLGHITAEQQSVNKCIKDYHTIAQLISIKPKELQNGDLVIDKDQLENISDILALIVRTLPNTNSKLTQDYSDQNPPYFTDAALSYLVSKGVKHLLTDLPSVDRERDEGKLQGHKTWWKYPSLDRQDCSITELIYVPTEHGDGIYFMNLQFAPLELDASPSRPVLYAMKKK